MGIAEIIKELAERTPQPEPVYWVESRPKCSRCRDFQVMDYGEICGHCKQEDQQGYVVMSLAGRCANGAERDHGTRYHAVTKESWNALCGAKPGRRSVGWTRELDAVTCPRCLKKLAKREA